MRAVFAGGDRPVVAGEATADDVGVIDAGHWCPAAGAVAVLAQVVGLNVSWVLAGGGAAVVAADAGGSLPVVVESGITPVTGSMAVFAFTVFLDGSHGWLVRVMAGYAIPGLVGAGENFIALLVVEQQIAARTRELEQEIKKLLDQKERELKDEAP